MVRDMFKLLYKSFYKAELLALCYKYVFVFAKIVSLYKYICNEVSSCFRRL